jgi:hypothetical protein
MTNILDHATQVSQQSEDAEPLLSKQLYDSVRKFSQDTAKDLKEAESELLNRGPMTRSLFELLRNNSEQGASKLEEITSEMLRLGYQEQAGRIGEKAQPSIDNLKKGIERAAESVIGDDTEALRMAERQLDDVSKQLQNEINRGQAAAGQTNGTSGTDGRQQGERAGLSQANTNSSGSAQASKSSGERTAQASGEGQQRAQAGGQQGSEQSQGAQAGEQPGSEQSQRAQAGGQRGSNRSQSAQASDQQGSEQSQSAQGDQPGQPQNGRGSGTQTADANPSEDSTDQASASSQNNGARRANRSRATQQAGASNAGGGDPVDAGAAGGARNWNWDRLLTQDAQRQNDPITGEDFSGWSDRLREVEQLVDDSGMRDEVAKARDRARVFRQDFKRERKKPDWAVLQLQVMKPLTEVHQKLVDELARRQSQDALVPLDRDPVPNQYSDLVRHYYEELGKEK